MLLIFRKEVRFQLDPKTPFDIVVRELKLQCGFKREQQFTLKWLDIDGIVRAHTLALHIFTCMSACAVYYTHTGVMHIYTHLCTIYTLVYYIHTILWCYFRPTFDYLLHPPCQLKVIMSHTCTVCCLQWYHPIRSVLFI